MNKPITETPGNENEPGGSLRTSQPPLPEWGLLRRPVDILHFLEQHPEIVEMIGKKNHDAPRFEEMLRQWIDLGRPDPETLPDSDELRAYCNSPEYLAPKTASWSEQ